MRAISQYLNKHYAAYSKYNYIPISWCPEMWLKCPVCLFVWVVGWCPLPYWFPPSAYPPIERPRWGSRGPALRASRVSGCSSTGMWGSGVHCLHSPSFGKPTTTVNSNGCVRTVTVQWWRFVNNLSATTCGKIERLRAQEQWTFNRIIWKFGYWQFIYWNLSKLQ